MAGLARWISGLRGWRRYGLAFGLGATATLALPPFYLLPFLITGFTGLLWLLAGARGWRGAFLVVWVFAWGHFIAGLWWIGEAFFVDAARFAILAPLPVLGLPAVAALYPALLLPFARRFAPSSPAQVLAVGLLWTLGEWLRGHLFSGFPWNLLGYVWSFSPLTMQGYAYVGVYGLSLITVCLAGLPAILGRPRSGAGRAALPWFAGAGVLMAGLVFGGLWRLPAAMVPDVPGVRLRIVQGNIAQKQISTVEERLATLQRYLQLSALPGADAVTTWIWPESSIGFLLDHTPVQLAEIRALIGPSGMLLAGGLRGEAVGTPDIKVWNSLQVVAAGGPVGYYDKRHLVPFGEYMPMRWLLGRIGLHKLTAGTLDFSAGSGPVVLDLPGLPPVRPLICYEAIFADEIAGPGGRPDWLVNVTNDAWFGSSVGPYQHFAAARARAVEQGVPMVRAANTGISGVIDPYGRVVQRLGLGQAGILDVGLPQAMATPPPYARLGDVTLLILAVGFFALLVVVQIGGKDAYS